MPSCIPALIATTLLQVTGKRRAKTRGNSIFFVGHKNILRVDSIVWMKMNYK
ncbi:unnamed protein product [Rhodiola kirilowii]